MNYREVFISRIRKNSSKSKYTRKSLSSLNLKELKTLPERLSSK